MRTSSSLIVSVKVTSCYIVKFKINQFNLGKLLHNFVFGTLQAE